METLTRVMSIEKSSSTSSPTVLVVEDDRAVASSLRLLLERRGCSVRTAQTIDHAKAQLDPDVTWLILDLVLPDGDGADLITFARQRGLSVQVTVLTGISDERRLAAVQRLGPAQLLKKPADFSELLGALKLRPQGDGRAGA